MARLRFFYGTMNRGKSTLALQIDHNRSGAGHRGLRMTMHERERGRITSRIGLARDAIDLTPHTDIEALVRDALRGGDPVDYIVADEVQFYTPAQIEQLARLVDDLDIEVFAFGLLSDFTTNLFPASKRLLEIADERCELQVQAQCWCGAPGVLNARTVRGDIVREGEQVVVDDVDDDAVAYEVLCREHHRLGITAATADRSPEPADSEERAGR
ncbi:MAG: thymidine kinase [Actinobacteria bacterium]|nr:thymidine kinase [Actinomycetota bacterium]